MRHSVAPMRRHLRIPLAAALAAAALTFAACGSGDDSSGNDAATTAPAAVTTVETTDTGGGVEITTGTVSANTASTDELIAALEANGVDNAAQWAREIEEYRPYDMADPELTHLQDELAKYNPDPDQLQKILDTLTP